MTTSTARRYLAEHLAPRYGAGEAAAIARIVVEDAFGARSRPEAQAWTPEEDQQFEAITERLLQGEPVQYVLGEADFFGLRFRVDPAVLIPRQETEELVAWILEYLQEKYRGGQPALLDIGLGSGCIGITLKKKFPGLRLFGLEKSPAALALARDNAARILGNTPDVQLLEGDVLQPGAADLFPALDLIASNPPYIPLVEKVLVPEHVAAHEPALALFVDNEDALLFYRAIAAFAQRKLRPGGGLFFECNEFNAREVVALLEAEGFAAVTLQKDLAGADRMVYASMPD